MLNWEKRSAICLGTATGLMFLHEELMPHIVHRDIKASNILLDRDFNPKIGDFGLAKLFPDNITHISTRIAGTTYVTFIFVVDCYSFVNVPFSLLDSIRRFPLCSFFFFFFLGKIFVFFSN